MNDIFSDRIVYPIWNPDGTIVNIGGRTLDPDRKENKLRKYSYFHSWGTMQTIYGYAENLKDILNKRKIILFEVQSHFWLPTHAACKVSSFSSLMDIDKLIQIIIPNTCTRSFSSLMDIDKLIQNDRTSSTAICNAACFSYPVIQRLS